MQKRLEKSSTNVMISGTLAGIAEFLGIDPTIVRLIYVIFSFVFAGAPVALYFILMMIIPSGKKSYRRNSRRNKNPYYDQQGPYKEPKRKMAEKVDEDDWSDF